MRLRESGFPNLAELSSDGLHEGVFTYEIGDPALKNELNLALNFVANYQNSFVEFSITPFYNYIFDYVYLSPTDEEWFGFPVYRYRQQNARQYGTEIILNFLPVRHMRTGISYAGMISKTEDDNYTPFSPGPKA
jgi:iron complex outermembrane receptor protein